MCRKKWVTGFERKWTRRSFRSYYHALKFICFSLSTTVATQCTFQSSHCWFIDYYRHHTTWSTQTKLHHCSYLYLSRSETILLTHSTEDLVAFIGVFHIPFKSNTEKSKKISFTHHKNNNFFIGIIFIVLMFQQLLANNFTGCIIQSSKSWPRLGQAEVCIRSATKQKKLK